MRFAIAVAMLSGVLFAAGGAGKDKKKQAPPQTSALDKYVEEALHSKDSMKPESAGSLWTASSTLGDLASETSTLLVEGQGALVVFDGLRNVSHGSIAEATIPKDDCPRITLNGETRNNSIIVTDEIRMPTPLHQMVANFAEKFLGARRVLAAH